jgi:hypothetical protein
VKCPTENEFRSLKETYEAEFRDVIEPSRRRLREKTLAKAGLIFSEGTIQIKGDGSRWNAVSMWKRVDLRMPRTTNSLEATHRHLNETISRRNSFWHSLAILTDSIAEKTLNFELALVHDFRTSLKRSKRRVQFVPEEQMREECAFFGATTEACGCEETVHISSMYHADIHTVPCSHPYVLGAAKSDIPTEMNLVVHATTAGMEYSETVHQRNPPHEIEAPRLKQYAVRQICRFSHSRDKEAIAGYVNDTVDPTGPSALDIPLAVHAIIARGIEIFTAHH